MASPDQAGVVARLIDLLRRITRVTQMTPFVFLLFFALNLITISVQPEWVKDITGKIFTMPVYLIICLLGIGKILKLCRWYITACLLPLLSKLTGYIDSFVFTLLEEEAVVINILIGVIYLVFIYCAFNHFLRGYGRKEGTT